MIILNNALKTVLLPLVRISLLLLLVWYLLCLFVPPGTGDIVIEVSFPAGSGVRKLAQELKQGGVIRSSWHFIIVSRLRGQARRLQAGEYRFNDAMTPSDILDKLATGDVDNRRFVLPEGYSIYQAAELLEQKGYFKKKAFLEVCHDQELLKRFGIQGDSVEGYLYPATYNLSRNSTEEQLVVQMVELFNKTYDRLLEADEAESTLSRKEIVTMASIIEKEAINPEEKPLISSVFHNRLRLKMPLQSDPTAIYGVRAFGGKVMKSDVEKKSPYNTYTIPGLPPGPIGNPDSGALLAAMKPASSKYLYFVARKDGSHQFSKTLVEHNRAVARYLK
jgi:UPF0755 protein